MALERFANQAEANFYEQAVVADTSTTRARQEVGALLLAVPLVGGALAWFLFGWVSRTAQVLAARGLTDFHTGLANRRAFVDELSVAWVRGHHERWDGGGYPDRLGGGAITEGAGILAVADSWDAMTASRPYRSALPAQSRRSQRAGRW